MKRGSGQWLIFGAAFWFAFLAYVPPAWSVGPFPTILDPKTYRSPSGRFELSVDPTQRYGEGPARYRLRKDGREVWAGKRAFTLCEAALADDGTVGGYGYLGGELGDRPFLVAVLTPEGRTITEFRTRRTDSRFLHQAPNPLARGVLIEPVNRELIVRVEDEDVNKPGEWWWVFPLEKRLSKLGPVRKVRIQVGEAGRWVLHTRHVPGTPLILTHWWRSRLDLVDRRVGAVFALMDGWGKVVWHHELPDDYRVPGDRVAEESLREQVRSEGAILEVSEPGRFTLRHAAEAQQVQFTVHRQESSWLVTEVARVPYAPKPTVGSDLDRLPRLALESLPPITLKPDRTPTRPAVRSIVSIASAGGERAVCLRAQIGDARSTALLVVTPDGKSEEVSLADLPCPGWSEWGGCAYVGGTRFVVSRSDAFRDGTGAAWWVDMRTKTTAPIPAYGSGQTTRLSGYVDGGFLVLGRSYHGSSIEDTLTRYSRAGDILWRLTADPGPGEHRLSCVPTDMCTSPDGSILLLCEGRVVGLNADGERMREFSLAKGKVDSLAEFVHTGAGLLVGRGSSNDSDWIRTFDEKGRRLSQVVPQLPGKHAITVLNMAGTESGAVWLSDSHALYRLDREGHIREIAGDPLDPHIFREGHQWVRGPRDAFYVLESRTQAVHVFGETGAALRVLAAPLRVNSGFRSTIAVKSNGSVSLYHSGRGFTSAHLAEFDPSGRFVGVRKSSWFIGAQVIGLPEGRKRWEISLDRVRLVSPGGRSIAAHERRPDGCWLTTIYRAAVAVDGTLVVLEGIPGVRERFVSTYSAEGQPLASWPVPQGVDKHARWGIACDRRRVFLLDGECLVAFDRTGTALWKARVPRTLFVNDRYLDPLLNPQNSELLLYDGKKTVYRLALPPSP